MERQLLVPQLFALVLFASPASATTMVASSLEQLVANSESVVHANTVATRTEWDAYRRIRTIATVRVLEAWQGPAAVAAELEVVSFGGVKDGIAMKVPGAPRFDGGEEVVLFLGRASDGSLVVVDLAQGKFEVVRTGSGVRLERRGLAEVEWVGGAAEAAPSLEILRERVAETALRLQRGGGLRGGAR